MRSSVVLLAAALAGFLGGAALIGLPVLGGALMFACLVTAAYALLRDDGQPAVAIREVPTTLATILDRARSAA